MRQLFSILTIGICLLNVQLKAQSNKYIKQGNKLYEENKFPEAQKSYLQALQTDSNSVPGRFNLGNALFKQKQFDASRQLMTGAVQKTTDKNVKAGANYNIGNTYMAERKWEDAVEAYKNALRNNPQDADAKYNLSYAKEMLKKDNQQNKDKKQDKNQQNKDQQNKDKNKQDKDKQDKDKNQQNKDQQNKDKDKDKQDKDGQGKDQQDKDKQDQQHPEPQPSKLTKKQAEELLNALDQQEKNLQDKKQKGKGVPMKLNKDW